MAREGDVIDGKYEIQTMIGVGGMSKVYLAMDRHLNKLWAVKEISKNAVVNKEVVAQSAIDEANMIKKLDHVALPRIVDILEDRDVIYVIMDYIEGTSLMDELDQRGAQPQDTVIYWAKQLCEVLDYLHTQNPPIIYRDLKPGNIMMKPDGNLKLIDFGIAREYKPGNARDTVALGTRGYAAPEQISNRVQTDARTDIYALGVTLHQLLTGEDPTLSERPLFEFPPIREINPSLSGGLEYVIQKCTMLNPEERYQSCAELLYALNHYEEADESYRKKQKRKIGAFAGIVAVMVLSMLVGIMGQVMKRRAEAEDYDANIKKAEQTDDKKEKIEYFINAIKNTNPNKNDAYDAYIGLIDTLKGDASLENETPFGTKEEEELRITWNWAEDRLHGDRSLYANLSFEIGKLYWYYYDYGRDTEKEGQTNTEKEDEEGILYTTLIPGKHASVDYFKEYVEYYENSKDRKTDKEIKQKYLMAKSYMEIGVFLYKIASMMTEADDSGEYEKYWNNIKTLVKNEMDNEDNPEIVRLEIARVAICSLLSFARQFRHDGVKKKALDDVCDQVKKTLDKVPGSVEKTIKMKRTLKGKGESEGEDGWLGIAMTAMERAEAEIKRTYKN